VHEEWKVMWKQVVMICFKVPSQNLFTNIKITRYLFPMPKCRFQYPSNTKQEPQPLNREDMCIASMNYKNKYQRPCL
jgi:hypothetical protein